MTDATKQETVKLLRTAKGKRPQYFSDPATDKLLAIVVSLISELATTRDRLDALERLIEKHGLFQQHEVENFQASEEETRARDAWRTEYLDRVFRVLQYELEEVSEGRQTSLDRIIDEFASEEF